MLLLYGEEGERHRPPPFRSCDDVRAKGTLVASKELQPVATATTVQVRGGDTVVRDGPFAETKETLGGYCLIEADSLDEALAWAAKIPSARIGSIEVRPVVPARVEAST